MLAGRIRSWTINLLATAIVLVGGLAIGRQVIGWWHEAAPDSAAADAVLAAASLPDLGPGQEFWTRGGALKIEHVQGGLKDAVAAMQAFCRTAADAAPSRPLTEAETKFVHQLAEEAPLEKAGNLALYQPRGQTSMVVAVDGPLDRIVAWSFALPEREGVWSLYHFRPAGAMEHTR